MKEDFIEEVACEQEFLRQRRGEGPWDRETGKGTGSEVVSLASR